MWEAVTASFGSVAELLIDKTTSNEIKSEMDAQRNISQQAPVLNSAGIYLGKDGSFATAEQRARIIPGLSSVKTEPSFDGHMETYARYDTGSRSGAVYPVKIESEFDAGTTVVEYETDGEEMSSVKPEHGMGSSCGGYSLEAGTANSHKFNPGVPCTTSVVWESKIPVLPSPKLKRQSKPRRATKQNKEEIKTQSELEAELAYISTCITNSNKTAAELIQEYGPRLKKLWKASRIVSKKRCPKSKADRMRDYRRWIKSLGEAGNPIARIMAERAAEYTRNRRERIKILAEAGDPVATVMFARLLENRRKYIERRKALRIAGGPVAEAMAERAREYTRKRTHRIKALAEAGDPVAKAKLERILESRKRYTERRRALRGSRGPAAKSKAVDKVLVPSAAADPVNG